MGTAGTLTNLDGPSLVAPKKPPWTVVGFVLVVAGLAVAEAWSDMATGGAGIERGWGVFNLLINEYEWSAISNFSQVGFFHGALPISVGVLAALLLSLPQTRRWVRQRP